MIAAHATGTPDNDAAEFARCRGFSELIWSVFLWWFQEPPGPYLGGAGAVELIPGDDGDARTGRAAMCERDGGGSGVSDVASNHRRLRSLRELARR